MHPYKISINNERINVGSVSKSSLPGKEDERVLHDVKVTKEMKETLFLKEIKITVKGLDEPTWRGTGFTTHAEIDSESDNFVLFKRIVLILKEDSL